MNATGKTRISFVLVTLVAAWIICEPQPLAARQSGAQVSPPPGSVNIPTRRSASPIGADPSVTRNGPVESSRRDEAKERAEFMLRRRRAAELAEDFDRLARINKERIVPLSSSSSFDYKVLAEAAGEVNKRAKRIKSNSPLPLKEKNNEKTAYDADAAALSAMLPELSRMIDSFLGNQIFRVTSVNDGELRSAAGRDLGRIIRLSEAINKIAKRSTKTAAIR